MRRSVPGTASTAASRSKAAQPANILTLFGGTFFAAIILLGILYSPALNSPFIFDDNYLPFTLTVRDNSLTSWLSGVRPLLMLTYWANYTLGGEDPSKFRLTNILIHAANSGFTFLILLRLLGMAGWVQPTRLRASVIGAVVFLIHPLQTESVTYIAGRSESLAAFFSLLAYLVFLHRPGEAISWNRAVVVTLLLGFATCAKEHAVALAGILVLTDLFWPRPFSIRALRMNWRLYAALTPAFMAGVLWVFRLLSTAPTAGFSLPGVTWQQYAYTQTRALFRYLQLAVIPIGQSLDHDFPMSHTVLEHGALWCAILLALMLVASIVLRRRFRLGSFGFLIFLVWLAPTSSIIPIADPLVERRMYLPLIGLILIGCELAGRLKSSRPVASWIVAALLLVYGGLCYERNREWGDTGRLLTSAAAQSNRNPRPHVMLAEYLIDEKRCDLAVTNLEKAVHKFPNDATIYVTWGRAIHCMGDRAGALEKLQRAAALAPTSSPVLQLIGLLYGEMKMLDEAGHALRRAVELAPNSTRAHDHLGIWYLSVNDIEAAEHEFKTAAALDPNDWKARRYLARIQQLRASEQTPEKRTVFFAR